MPISYTVSLDLPADCECEDGRWFLLEAVHIRLAQLPEVDPFAHIKPASIKVSLAEDRYAIAALADIDGASAEAGAELLAGITRGR